MTIEKIHHIELFVSNIEHTKMFYCNAYGFEIVAHLHENTECNIKISYLLKQNNIYLILTSYARSKKNNHINMFLEKHGDGVKDICFFCTNIKELYLDFKRKNIAIIKDISITHSSKNIISEFVVKAFGDIVHTFVNYNESKSNSYWESKGFTLVKDGKTSKNECNYLDSIDHIAFCGKKGFIEKVSNYYCNNFSFVMKQREIIKLGNNGMNTMVLESENASIKFPIVEPLNNNCRSNLDDFIQFNNGDGIHHVAFLTNDIISVYNHSTSMGTSYLKYKFNENNSIKDSAFFIENLDTILSKGIIVDITKRGYLLQIFSQFMQTRPTFFLEIIQRYKRDDFGARNIKKLYKLLE